MCLVLLVRHHIGRVTVVSTVQLPPSLYLPTSKVHRLRRVCVCVRVFSIMAMHPVGMGRYDVPAMYILSSTTCSSSEANHETR
jgi:hypothetical protein